MKEENGKSLIEFLIIGVLLIISIVVLLITSGKMVFNTTREKANAEISQNIAERLYGNSIEEKIEKQEYYENNSSNKTAEEIINEMWQDSIKTSVTISKEELENLTIDNSKINELYEYVDKTEFYRDEKVTLENLDNETIVKLTFNHLKELHTESEYEKGFATLYSVKKEKVEQRAKEIFGDNVEIIHDNIYDSNDLKSKYEDGIYYDVDINESYGRTQVFLSYVGLIDMKIEEEDIILYDKFAHVTRTEIENEDIMAEAKYDVYTTLDETIKLAENVEKDKILNPESKYLDMWTAYSEFSKPKIEYLDNFVNNQLLTFKHTFKKSNDGIYYWYSSEPIYE